MKKVSIQQVEPQFAQQLESPLKVALKQLGYSVPENFRLRVSLLQADGRKKRSNASAETWAPESDRMEFWLEPSNSEMSVSPPTGHNSNISTGTSETQARVPPAGAGGSGSLHPAEVKLLRALDRAESTPGWSFVSLKRFRDDILPQESFAAGEAKLTDVHWQELLRDAIEKKLILTRKVQNPKSPQFPVTAIRINRLLPEVQAVLGLAKKTLGFHPIHIKGEPLSAVILRERR